MTEVQFIACLMAEKADQKFIDWAVQLYRKWGKEERLENLYSSLRTVGWSIDPSTEDQGANSGRKENMIPPDRSAAIAEEQQKWQEACDKALADPVPAKEALKALGKQSAYNDFIADINEEKPNKMKKHERIENLENQLQALRDQFENYIAKKMAVPGEIRYQKISGEIRPAAYGVVYHARHIQWGNVLAWVSLEGKWWYAVANHSKSKECTPDEIVWYKKIS